MSGLLFHGIGLRRVCTPVRLLRVSAVRKTLQIESEDDFKKKVIESEIPVIVDFHAMYVLTYVRRALSMRTNVDFLQVV